jgi:hypothetical protein
VRALLVDDAHRNTVLEENERQDETRGTCAGLPKTTVTT